MVDKGLTGQYGGSYIPEILHGSQQSLVKHFREAMGDPEFLAAVQKELQQFSGRPTPLTHCENLSKKLGGAQIYLKREDLNHSGAHKMTNVIGQGLLTKRMGKKRIIAETGAGQHGVACSLIAARLGLECTVYMGAEDIKRQYPNVFWMKQLGAEVVPVTTGSQTLRDALDEALRDWSQSYPDTHYLIGTACGCEPFPEMVAGFQSVIGREVIEQCQQIFNGLPDKVYACVGGGSNACGIFLPMLDHPQVELVGVEAGGIGDGPGEHAKRFHTPDAKPGIAQGFSSLFLQDNQGQLMETQSISAGLDYVSVSPILANLESDGKVRMTAARDHEVIDAFRMLAKHEGVIPALESSHAVAGALREAAELSPNQHVVINISGRGDKDIFNIAKAVDDQQFNQFLKDFLAEQEAE